MYIKLIQGNSLEKLKELPEESIDCIVTSPPYWALRDYQTATWEGGDVNCNHINGTLMSNKSTLYNEIKNDNKKRTTGMPYKEICGKCGAKRVDKQLGLEDTFQEYINKLCDIFDECKRVLKKTGTCWVNIGDTYGTKSGGNFENDNITKKNKDEVAQTTGINRANQLRGTKPNMHKNLCNIPARFSIEMQNRGWILRNVIIWHKPNCMPSSIKDRFTVDFEYLYFFVKNPKYYFKQQIEPIAESTLKDKRLNKGLVEYKGGKTTQKEGGQYAIRGVSASSEGRNKRTVWTIIPRPFKKAHFATYPEKLIETPIDAGCPEQGTVLDPFVGSGTTGVVALKQNKNFIGIDLNPEYVEMARERIEDTKNQLIKSKQQTTLQLNG